MINGQIIKTVHEKVSVEENIGARWAQAPSEFFKGWYLSLSGQEFFDYDCYKPNGQLTNALYDAMESYRDGDRIKGDTLMEKSEGLFNTAI